MRIMYPNTNSNDFTTPPATTTDVPILAREKSFETDTLEKLTVQYYLTHADDVRKCPKGDCKYSGYLVDGYCKD